MPADPLNRRLSALLQALFLSGVAGLINQVVWQRALKIYLGGSETLSSMTVVLVFMFGLGIGSVAIGQRTSRLRSPLMALALTELAIATITIAVCALLSLNLTQSVYEAQRLAVGTGIPLRAIYIMSALVLLGPPCLLMGMTMPLASEGSQRQLGHDDPWLISRLFFVNTVGALMGALATGFYLMPRFGQRTSLVVAAAVNVLAGVRLVGLARQAAPVAASSLAQTTAPAFRRHAMRVEDTIGFLLGFVALSYEMVLLREAMLVHGPLPETFAATLCGFLILWSMGVYGSNALRIPIAGALLLVAALMVALPLWVPLVMRAGDGRLLIASALAVRFVPCFLFGLLYGHLVSRVRRDWGHDVGWFYGWNTFGACLGILVFTLIGYELDPISGGACLAVALLGSAAIWKTRVERSTHWTWRTARWAAIPIAGAIVVVGLLFPSHRTTRGRVFYGRDGVIEVKDRRLIWDGLWHSALSQDRDHVGTRNWLLAVAPLVAHEGPVTEAVVIGLGAGITSATLARVDQITTVDTYDINHTLQPFLAAYPDGTLNVATNPRVRMLWQDGRTGLALSGKRYDLITQQPLYLKQAGSGILLSQEYLKLVRARLKPGGVAAIYSNSPDAPEQALLVRQTVASVFPYYESFEQGYLIVASDSPIELSDAAVTGRLDLYPLIKDDVAWLETARTTPEHSFRFYDLYDRTRLSWSAPYVITDDHPLVEYPELARRLLTGRK